jgi:hypothetical protein
MPNPYNTLIGRSRDELRASPNPTLADVVNWMGAERAQRASQQSKVAALVIEAGRMARGEIAPPLPKKGTIARLVIDAGERARGREPSDSE